MTEPGNAAYSTLAANPGADAALERFIRSGRLPHAILIEGAPGSGKTTLARRLAQIALCTDAKPPCGTCGSCVKAVKNIHPDLLFFTSEGGGRSFHVDKIRELREKARFAPGEAARTVLVLENAQNMTVQAQNALLKILEEPPGTAVFILTCRNRAELLDTILSRTTLVSLELPGVDVCAQILADMLPGKTPEQLLNAARDAQGSVGEALRLLEADADASFLECARELLDAVASGRELDALILLQPYERDRQGFMALLRQLRARAGALILEGVGLGMRRLLKVLDAVDDAERAALQNMGGLLLITSLCTKLSAIFDE